ncbi:MAG: hypothetical protein RLZZ387_5759 [Chloroflexota bacterium]|jgi:hypothetical protein
MVAARGGAGARRLHSVRWSECNRLLKNSIIYYNSGGFVIANPITRQSSRAR